MRIKSSIILSGFLALLVIAGCRKSDNPRIPDLERVPLPQFTLAEEAPTKIPGGDPLTFSSTFDVDVYFKSGDKPKQFDIVVVKNGDKANPKVIQAAVTSFPTTITVTGQQLTDLFGADIILGDVFEIGADVTTTAGKKWEAFPVTGVPYAPGIAAQPNSVTALRFAAPCLFVSQEYQDAEFVVEVDDWADYAPGDDIEVVTIDENTFSFKYLAGDAQPIIMKVDPVTNAITVDYQYYGTYGPDDYFIESVPGDNSEVDPCTTTFKIFLHHSIDGGSADAQLIITKK